MTLDYDNPKDAASQRIGGSWRPLLMWCAGGLVVFVIGVLLLLPSFGRARETAKRIMCGNNLRQIAVAMRAYSHAHGGALPNDLIVLFRYADITSHVYTCPSSEIHKAEGATQDEIVAAMLSGGHLSYARTGGGLTTSATGDIVVAFDLEMHFPKDYAKGAGMNVLFADGQVTFVNEAEALSIRAQFAAGVRPIRLPTTTPAATGN